ncbi:24610_t:CDS:2, partial [Racocetra persica]
SYLKPSEKFNGREESNKLKSLEQPLNISLNDSSSEGDSVENKENYGKLIKKAQALLNPEPETCSLQVKVLNNNIFFDLKHSDGSMNFERLINFGDDIKSIKTKFENWRTIDQVITKMQTELEYYKLCYFFKLINRYSALYKLVIKEPQDDLKKLSLKEKINNGISLGANAKSKSKRK